MDMPAILFPNKIQTSVLVQRTDALATAGRQQRYHVLAEVVVAFSLCARIFGRMLDNSFLACAFFFFFFLKWRLAPAH